MVLWGGLCGTMGGGGCEGYGRLRLLVNTVNLGNYRRKAVDVVFAHLTTKLEK